GEKAAQQHHRLRDAVGPVRVIAERERGEDQGVRRRVERPADVLRLRFRKLTWLPGQLLGRGGRGNRPQRVLRAQRQQERLLRRAFANVPVRVAELADVYVDERRQKLVGVVPRRIGDAPLRRRRLVLPRVCALQDFVEPV